LLVALGSARAMRSIEWMRKNFHIIQINGGITMFIVGILLVSGVWAYFMNWFLHWTVENDMSQILLYRIVDSQIFIELQYCHRQGVALADQHAHRVGTAVFACTCRDSRIAFATA